MWQRFTERARRTVFFAQEEAGSLGETLVSTEHLLLGIVRESDSVASRILDRMGVSLARIRSEIMRHATTSDAPTNQGMELSPDGKRVIDLAYDEARQLSNNYIGTEHLLLGLIRYEEGLAGRVLAQLGVEVQRARREVMALQDTDSASVKRTRKPGSAKALAMELGEQFAAEFERLAPEEQTRLQDDGVPLAELPESMLDLVNRMFLPVLGQKEASPTGSSFSSSLAPSGPVVVGVVDTSGVKQYTVAATATLIANYLVVPPSR